ncbi:polysulfide reductase NrfD [soil metagenome]
MSMTEKVSRLSQPQTEVRGLRSRESKSEPCYYNVSILKSPVWKWEIATYFFLGGLSAASYTLARIAERAGSGKYRHLTRAGTFVAFAAMLPCAPLLIRDLGDRKRFHHMLRVFKPSSPMNLGTWLLLGFSGISLTAVLREKARDGRGTIDRFRSRGLISEALCAAHDAAGIPLALGVAGYTGVLLSCTANPMWCKNPWLGPLFMCSAFGTGAAATSLAMAWRNESAGDTVLDRVETVSRIGEAITLAGYLKHAGETAKPLTRGSMKKHLGVAIGALVVGEVLQRLPVPRRAKRFTRVASALATLAGGLSLRWAMVHGGHEAANDPRLARLATSRSGQPQINTDRHG